jgi:carbonic anhydrase
MLSPFGFCSCSSQSEATKITRRRAMRAVAGIGFVASSGFRMRSIAAAEEAEILPATPSEALKKLYAGNARFAKGESLSEHRDLARVRNIAAKQTPFAAFLGCADSRVPIEFVFDQGFGDLFVTRIAGNIASSENIGSLEFGTRVLGAKILFVLGHSSCGAVSATMQGEEVPGQISGLFQHIRPATRAANGDLNKAISENVKNQALILAEASPVIAKLVRDGELIVAGGVYDLATGIVNPVEVPKL